MLFKSNTFLLRIFHCKMQTVLRKKKWTVEQVTGKWKSRKVEKLMMHMVKFEKPKSRTVSFSTFHFLGFRNFVRCLSSWTCAVLFFLLRAHPSRCSMLLPCLKMKHPPFLNGHCSWEISWSTSGFGWNIWVFYGFLIPDHLSQPLVQGQCLFRFFLCTGCFIETEIAAGVREPERS